ncbi:hypothetical protein ACFIJ5_04720 [Haloimpatiens sp. FM7330]
MKIDSNNTWKFFIDENKSLIYSNNYGEEKLEENVLEFDVNIKNHENTIQIIYITENGKLQYGEYKKSWSMQTLYDYSDKNIVIKEIKFYNIREYVHIFFILQTKSKGTATLFQYVWNGKKFYTNNICSLNLIENTNEHYQIEILNNQIINIFFLNIELSEITLNTCKYTHRSWSYPTKLYRLNGNNINFSTLYHKNQIHILNLSEENSIYSLEHVVINTDMSMQSSKVFESKEVIDNPTLIVQNNILYTMWINNNNILYSSYMNKWSQKNLIDTVNTNIILCKYLYKPNEYSLIKSINVLYDISQNTIYSPNNSLNCNTNYTSNISDKKSYSDSDKKNIKLQTLLNELSNLKVINQKLKNKLHSIKIQLAEKEKISSQSDNYLNQILIQKKRLEKKYNDLLKNQHNTEKNISSIQNELQAKQEKEKNYEEKISKLSKVNEELKNKIQQSSGNNEQLKTLQNKITEYKNIIKELKSANESLKSNYSSITVEFKRNIQKLSKQNKELKNKIQILNNSNKKFKMNQNEKAEFEKIIEELHSENQKLKLDHSKMMEFKYTVDELSKEKENIILQYSSYIKNLQSELLKNETEKNSLQKELENEKNKSFIKKFLKTK